MTKKPSALEIIQILMWLDALEFENATVYALKKWLWKELDKYVRGKGEDL